MCTVNSAGFLVVMTSSDSDDELATGSYNILCSVWIVDPFKTCTNLTKWFIWREKIMIVQWGNANIRDNGQPYELIKCIIWSFYVICKNYSMTNIKHHNHNYLTFPRMLRIPDWWTLTLTTLDRNIYSLCKWMQRNVLACKSRTTRKVICYTIIRGFVTRICIFLLLLLWPFTRFVGCHKIQRGRGYMRYRFFIDF